MFECFHDFAWLFSSDYIRHTIISQTNTCTNYLIAQVWPKISDLKHKASGTYSQLSSTYRRGSSLESKQTPSCYEMIVLNTAPAWDIRLLCQFIWSCHRLEHGWGHIRQVVDFFFPHWDHYRGRCQTTSPFVCSVSWGREDWCALQRKFLQQTHSVENPRETCHGWKRGLLQRGSSGRECVIF